MTIKLKGILHSELDAIGLKPGMIIDENPDINSTSGVVHFETIHGGRTYSCSVWPENYERRQCRICGCTDNDCHQCIEKTGEPCYWVEWDLCSACAWDKKLVEFDDELEDMLRSTGHLFPITPDKVAAFQKLNPTEEVPDDCKDPLKELIEKNKALKYNENNTSK